MIDRAGGRRPDPPRVIRRHELDPVDPDAEHDDEPNTDHVGRLRQSSWRRRVERLRERIAEQWG